MKIVLEVDYKHALDIAKQVQDIRGVKEVSMKYNSKGSKLERIFRR